MVMEGLVYEWMREWMQQQLSMIAKGPMYRKVSNIRRTKSQNLNVSRLIL